MAKVKKAVKAARPSGALDKSRTNPKMVPESEAFDSLCYFASKVIVSNRITRNLLGNFLDDIDDHEMEKTVIQAIAMLVVQDDEQRAEYVEQFADNDFGTEVYDLAMDIREVLGLNGYDNFKNEGTDI